MNKIMMISIVFASCSSLSAQQKIPADVSKVMAMTANKNELLAVLQHYQTKEEDTLKFKAACFLIANMDIHYSETYYWADSTGKRIVFDELSHPDFATAIDAFNKLKLITGQLHAIRDRFSDIDSMKSSFLIDNIDRAFEAWKLPFAKNIDFNDFSEYLLPYRISVEPLQNWRSIYKDRFKNISDSAENNFDRSLQLLKNDINRWFTCTYNLEKRNEPLPRLGALQLLQRKKGPCEDVADMTTFALRSLGIPACVDVVPLWATSTGNHTLNVAFNNTKATPYDILLLYDSMKDFIREPAKVLRITYSKQKNTLPFFEDKNNIPPGLLRLTNYKDVTAQYWPVKDVTCILFKEIVKTNIVYACVLNGLKWQPAWWGNIKNNAVIFENMCKGAVFLPMIYKQGKLVPAGYPVASGYNNIITLEPSAQTHTIHLREQEHYVLYRPGKKYKLYYWKNNWVLLKEKKADDKTTELVFDNVPKNALLLIVPEYSQKKERPFIITDKGERVWW